MTLQTTAPIRELRLSTSAVSWGEIVRNYREGDLTLDAPYQRGSVWTDDQRRLLIFSILSHTPIPALITNLRPSKAWFAEDGSRLPMTAMIDGKQRLTAVEMFMAGELFVPASWFEDEFLRAAIVDGFGSKQTDDGLYVSWKGLTKSFHLGFARIPVPLCEGRLTTVEEEAEVYLRVNGAGTPQTDEDMARAAEVAKGEAR